jgi:FkbM family methyltransferase
METKGNRIVSLKVPYSDRTFAVSGSPADQSVVGAIDKAAGIWEPEVMGLMARLIKPDDICLDIGANVGVHTLAMAELAPLGHVHAFEPSSVTFAYLKDNIQHNGITNATAHHLGLSEVPGERQFHYFDDYAGCSLSGGGGEGPDIDAVMKNAWGVAWNRITETVPFTTLDIWVAATKPRRLDLIKMDVEGFERYVVEGGSETLGRFRPKLITEFNKKSLQAYYGIDPRSYYDLLRTLYDHLYVIKADSPLLKIETFDDLRAELSEQRFWADILCLSADMSGG